MFNVIFRFRDSKTQYFKLSGSPFPSREDAVSAADKYQRENCSGDWGYVVEDSCPTGRSKRDHDDRLCTCTDNKHLLQMKKAFDLVCPEETTRRMVERIPSRKDALDYVSWKGEICALVTEEDLTSAGVTIEDVAESVEFYTATTAIVTRQSIGSLPWKTFDAPKPGYLVRAKGYRLGPAGDY